ncbi:protein-L-isoaspartate O-methyltransferase family protein [Methyloceanibacter sp.]|uniref:protein-L-isoaspartate O-methyltransferase family protein n=1 Tax=Methyloceanibacter sp. TaxID=1965321 RepID=UPI003D6C9B7A
MIDFERARASMVESQLRTDKVTDRRILSAFAALPRERFVPEGKRDLAYSDASLEVWPSIDGAPARFLLPPVVLARLIQLAAVEEKDAVLDVGCATGYSTAVLARLARLVTAVEAEPELAAAARESLHELELANAAVLEGALTGGAPEAGPFDVILLNGSVPEMPDTLLAQLKEGGRLCAIIAAGREGRPRQGKATLFVKVDGEASGLPHFDANARVLPGFAPSPSFTF